MGHFLMGFWHVNLNQTPTPIILTHLCHRQIDICLYFVWWEHNISLMHFKHLSHSHSFTQFIWQNNNVSLLHLFICPFGNSRHITDCFVTIDLKCKYKIDSDCSAEWRTAVWKNFHWNYLKIMQTLAKNVFIGKKEAKKSKYSIGTSDQWLPLNFDTR